MELLLISSEMHLVKEDLSSNLRDSVEDENRIRSRRERWKKGFGLREIMVMEKWKIERKLRRIRWRKRKKVNENSEEFLSTVRVDVSNQTKMPTTIDQLNKDVKLGGSYVVVFHWRIHVYQFKILAVYLRVMS
jgi:hypothetical protein